MWLDPEDWHRRNFCVDCDNPPEGMTRYCRDHQYWNWHGWFAWYPVKTLTDQWVWLQFIIRKRQQGKSYRDVYWWQKTFWYRVPDRW